MIRVLRSSLCTNPPALWKKILRWAAENGVKTSKMTVTMAMNTRVKRMAEMSGECSANSVCFFVLYHLSGCMMSDRPNQQLPLR